MAALSQAHTSSVKLEDQAATAALYAINQTRDNNSDGLCSFDGNNKVPFTGADITLSYGNLENLPNTGSKKSDFAAGVAANLGWASQKRSEHWIPDPSASASKAAMLAKNYKAPPLWQPEQNTNCTKAAIIAARAGGKYEAQKTEASAWGNSAANQAFKLERNGNLSPQIESRNLTGLGRQGSLVAATGAMAGHRRRSDSTPIPRPTYPDESNAVVNALSAATHANKPSEKLKPAPLPEPATTPFINMPREMFTSHPPVAPEADERNRADSLRASAIAMAKKMYSMQKIQIDEASKVSGNDVKSTASSPHGHLPSSPSADETTPMQFNSLQEAAQRLAQERLAKLHNEHIQSRAYRGYNGSSPRQKSRLSIRGRRRACSESSLNDKEQLEKIHAQMSLFSSNLPLVDSKRQQLDREALMAIAQRNVTASLHGMDQQVLKDTGKIPPSMLNEWEAKAHTAAQRNSESRMANYGKISIGGGSFIDQSMVNQVAARNIRPVLDEINDKAEQERVRQAEYRLVQQANKRLAETKKARDKEIKEINRKLKEQDKGEERARKEEDKTAKTKQKRLAKEEKRKSKEVPIDLKTTLAEPAVAPADTRAEMTAQHHETCAVEELDPEMTASAAHVTSLGSMTSTEMKVQQTLDDVVANIDEASPMPQGSKGVKTWLKTKFGRRVNKGRKSESMNDGMTDDKTFIGGAALTRASTNSNEPSNTSLEDIALAGKNLEQDENRSGRSKRRASSVNSLSTLNTPNESALEVSREQQFNEGRDRCSDEHGPLPTYLVTKSSSPARDSRFHEAN